jgi:hypothetical protein
MERLLACGLANRHTSGGVCALRRLTVYGDNVSKAYNPDADAWSSSMNAARSNVGVSAEFRNIGSIELVLDKISYLDFESRWRLSERRVAVQRDQ